MAAQWTRLVARGAQQVAWVAAAAAQAVWLVRAQEGPGCRTEPAQGEGEGAAPS